VSQHWIAANPKINHSKNDLSCRNTRFARIFFKEEFLEKKPRADGNAMILLCCFCAKSAQVLLFVCACALSVTPQVSQRMRGDAFIGA
jgi:hypothetical protein